MMIRCKRILAILLITVFIGCGAVDALNVQAVSATELNTYKKSIFTGSVFQLKVSGTSSKATWSSANEKTASVYPLSVSSDNASVESTIEVNDETQLNWWISHEEYTGNSVFTNVTLKTDKSAEIVIYEGNPKMTVTIDAPNCIITNEAAHKSIKVINAKKYFENCNCGNTIINSDKDLEIFVRETARINKVENTSKNANLYLINEGTVNNLVIKKTATATIEQNGTLKKLVVSGKSKICFQGSSYTKSKVVMQKGAEGSEITIFSAANNMKVTNKTKEKVSVKFSSRDTVVSKQTIKSGKSKTFYPWKGYVDKTKVKDGEYEIFLTKDKIRSDSKGDIVVAELYSTILIANSTVNNLKVGDTLVIPEKCRPVKDPGAVVNTIVTAIYREKLGDDFTTIYLDYDYGYRLYQNTSVNAGEWELWYYEEMPAYYVEDVCALRVDPKVVIEDIHSRTCGKPEIKTLNEIVAGQNDIIVTVRNGMIIKITIPFRA